MFALVVSVIVCGIAFLIGVKFLRMMATPVPPPPPEGEMRRVNIRYRCEVCGTVVKMTQAANQEPEAPRHCMEEMTLEVPIEI